MKAKKWMRLALAKQMEAAPRGEPVCRHFGECGGCEFQDVDYCWQVKAKREVLLEMAELKELPNIFDPEKGGVEVMTEPSPQPLGYRQRMDYVFAFGKAGLRKRNSHKWVVGLEECPLLGEKGFAAFARARDLALEMDIPCYNYLSHKGYLRYFVVRRTRQGEVLVSLVTKSNEREDEIEKIATTLLEEGLADSVYWLLQDGLCDMSFGEPLKYFGKQYITECYGELKFLIGPNTFFQANPAVAQKAYAEIAQHCAEFHPEIAVDAYSGTGVIAQHLASVAKKVLAVENVEENVEISGLNCTANGVDNVEMTLLDAAEYLAQVEGGENGPEYIAVNPPRVGIGEKAARNICRIAPRGLGYMSCNPLTLMDDLKILLEDYVIESVTVHDMFPQTRHWETVVLMRRKDA